MGLRESRRVVVALLLTASARSVARDSATSPAAHAATPTSSTLRSDASHHQCGLYLAPSTIPGAGLGMFNGDKPRQLWEPIGPADLVIPVTDYVDHNSETSDLLMNFYGWSFPSFAHVSHDARPEGSTAFCPGPGAALNCLMGLVNTVALDEEVLYETFTTHSSKPSRDQEHSRLDREYNFPHAGSFTPFSNRQLVSKVDLIEPGAELFDSYGDSYFRDRSMYDTIPVTGDYEEADEMLENYLNLRTQLCGEDLCHRPAAVDSVASSSSLHEALFQMMHSLRSVWPSAVLNALPETPESVETLTTKGTALRDYNRSIQSLEWLQKHGDCMDHLVIRPSNIAHAGHGAFAKTPITEGSVIAPAPLLHIPRSFMKMHPVSFDDDTQEYFVDQTSTKQQQQLLLNYCFGHKNSSVLLCPYGAATSAINHNAATPNARVEWNMKLMQHPEWLEQPVRQWINTMSTGLVIKYVATRDIQEGEEVTIDYGRDWVEAWHRHLEEFVPPADRRGYEDAAVLNQREEKLKVMPSQYDDTFAQLKCRGVYLEWFGTHDHRDGDASPNQSHVMTENDSDKPLCRPLHSYTDQQSGETLYTVLAYRRFGRNEQCYEEELQVLFNMPRDSLVFEDRMYSRDHAQPRSFRHEMSFPHDLFPIAWFDLKTS